MDTSARASRSSLRTPRPRSSNEMAHLDGVEVVLQPGHVGNVHVVGGLVQKLQTARNMSAVGGAKSAACISEEKRALYQSANRAQKRAQKVKRSETWRTKRSKHTHMGRRPHGVPGCLPS
jgi:hypothetical protein